MKKELLPRIMLPFFVILSLYFTLYKVVNQMCYVGPHYMNGITPDQLAKNGVEPPLIKIYYQIIVLCSAYYIKLI
jgi:hypothetical protein